MKWMQALIRKIKLQEMSGSQADRPACAKVTAGVCYDPQIEQNRIRKETVKEFFELLKRFCILPKDARLKQYYHEQEQSILKEREKQEPDF